MTCTVYLRARIYILDLHACVCESHIYICALAHWQLLLGAKQRWCKLTCSAVTRAATETHLLCTTGGARAFTYMYMKYDSELLNVYVCLLVGMLHELVVEFLE